MKFQWSIQSSHTHITQSQVTYLTSRNERIWPFTKVFTLIESFSFGFHFSYFLINTTQFFSIAAMKIFIFFWRISLLLWHHTFWIHFAPPFPTLTSFWSKAFLVLSPFWRLTFEELFDRKIKCEEIYKIKSMHVSRSIKAIS